MTQIINKDDLGRIVSATMIPISPDIKVKAKKKTEFKDILRDILEVKAKRRDL